MAYILSVNDKPKPVLQSSPKPELVFAQALLKAQTELDRLIEEEKKIAIRKAQLRETIKALSPLVSPGANPTDLGTMSLANAIRIVVASAQRPLNALEIRGRLSDLGYKLTQHKNPMASIHTAIRRMQENSEVKKVELDGAGKETFEQGPELKKPDVVDYLAEL